MESEEEALFRSYPYALYYVQSPSTISHANSTTVTNLINHNNELQPYDHSSHQDPTTHLALLSRYSSSRESNNSFSHNNKLIKKYDDDQNVELENDKNGVDAHHQNEVLSVEDNEGYYGNYYGRGRDWRKYFSFSYSDSGWWIFLQLSWRLLLSLIIALVVFYVAAKPPAPKVSIKMAGVRPFRLGEGVDSSGVTTKILSFNCSINLIIDNKSKLFGLHINPPIVKMLFTHLPIAVSQGAELYAGSDDTSLFNLIVGTRNKPMYGAGRSMQDLLESNKGLPLIVRVSLRSNFQVIWGIFEQKYRHEVQCSLILDMLYVDEYNILGLWMPHAHQYLKQQKEEKGALKIRMAH